MSENIKVTFDTAEEDLHVNLDAGAIMYGKLKVGTTTTGDAGTSAKVENVGTNVNAILNFTIPKGDKGEQGEKGEKGDTGSPVEVKDIPANTNVDDFFEEGTYAWNGDDGKAITGLPNDIVDMPSFSYMLKITKHSTMTNEKNKFEHYFQEFWLEGLFIYTRKITVRTGLETGRIFYERYSWERKALVNYDGVTVVSTEPTNETEKAKVWLQKNKNLLNFSSFGTKTINGVTFTNNGNGTITINGTANTSFGVNFVKFNLGAGTYHLSVNANTSQNFYIYDYDTNTNILSKEETITLTKNYNNIGFDTYINNGQVFDNLIISPQLEVGSSASVFEENVTSAIYTKNNNNEYEKFSETVAISSHQPANQNGLWLQKGKNLISGFTPGLFYDYTNKVFQNGTPFSTSDFIDVEYGMTYTFSHALNGVGGYVGCFDENGNFLETKNNDTMLTPFTITNANCKKIICVSWDSNSNPSVNETWMQLEVGNTATEYEEYKDKKIYVKNYNGVYEEFLNADEVKNDYSLGERRIGTWIDGKPLYRKVIKGVTDSTTTSATIGNISNVDTLVYSYGTALIAGQYSTAINSYFNDTLHSILQLDINTGDIIFSYSQGFAGWEYDIVLEYTKTTDVATTSEE